MLYHVHKLKIRQGVMTAMTEINIAFAATKNWFEFTMTSIISILSNTQDSSSYHFYIMSSCFTEEDKNNFHKIDKFKKAEYTFIEMDDSEYDKFYKNPLGNSTNYRLKLSSITNVDKMLYLDSDIIALDDVSELYNIDINDYYIAAVEDKCSDNMKCRVTRDSDFIFINAGMVLMNLKKFRINNVEEQLFEFLSIKNNGYCDQDAINAVCYNHIKYLPIKFNIMVGFMNNCSYNKEQYSDALNNPVLIHFIQKPWSNSLKTEFTQKWKFYNDLLHTII